MRRLPPLKLPAPPDEVGVAVLGIVLGAALATGVSFARQGGDGVSVESYAEARDEVERLAEENAELSRELDLMLETAEESGQPNLSAYAKRGKHVRANVRTSFNEDVERPRVAASAYIDPEASVIGDVVIGQRVYVGPNASVRADEGQPFKIGDEVNIQDGVTMHALETSEDGKPVGENLVTVGGKRYAIYVGDRVSLAHDALVHGPAAIGSDTFVGMKAFVFRATVGAKVVIEPAAVVIGVNVPSGRYVPAGEIVTSQEDADDLPEITEEYQYRELNDGVLDANVQLASGYNGRGALDRLVSAETETAEHDMSAGPGQPAREKKPAREAKAKRAEAEP